MHYCQRSLKILFIITLALCVHSSAHAQKLRFLVLGDWGREGRDLQTAVANAMTKQASKDHPAFVLSTGDNFYKDGVASVTDSQFQTSFERIYSAPSLHIPWYVSLGNHDYHTHPEAEIAYTAVSDRWKMPSRYFAQEIPVDDTTSALFLIIDTSPFITQYQREDSVYHVIGQSTQVQLRWMDSVLAHSHAKWKFAVGHHPVYSAAKTHGDTPELIAQVLPIFRKYHLNAYFCGHDHNLQHLVDAGFHSYLSGGGCEAREVKPRADTKFVAASAGFLEVTLSTSNCLAEFYNSDDKKLDTSSMKP